MTSDTTRRTFLRTAATGLAAGGVVAASTPAAAASDLDSWLSNTSNYEGVVDKTGQSEVAVEVGAQGNGGNYAFAPAAIHVDPGTTVTWKWVAGTHDVAAKDGRFNSKLTGEKGFTFSRTFDSAGTTKYYCTPHKAMGMKGAIVVGGSASSGSGAGGGLEFDLGLLGLAAGGASVLLAPLALGVALGRDDDDRGKEYPSR